MALAHSHQPGRKPHRHLVYEGRSTCVTPLLTNLSPSID